MILTILLFLLLAILQVLDLFLTKKVICEGGRELNTVMKNPKLWAPLKAIGSLFCLIVALLTSWIALIIPNIIMIGVCMWNYRQLRK